MRTRETCGSWHDHCRESAGERFCRAIRVAEAIEPVNMATRCGILMDFLSVHGASKKAARKHTRLRLRLATPCRDEIQKEQANSDYHERCMAVDGYRRIMVPLGL